MNIDQARLEAFMGKMIGLMTGGTICYSIWLGDELGLYRELLSLVEDRSVALEEYARQLIQVEELHAGEAAPLTIRVFGPKLDVHRDIAGGSRIPKSGDRQKPSDDRPRPVP